MTKDERIALENIKKLLLHGKFTLHGIECIAFAKAMEGLNSLLAPKETPIAPEKEKEQKRAR